MYIIATLKKANIYLYVSGIFERRVTLFEHLTLQTLAKNCTQGNTCWWLTWGFEWGRSHACEAGLKCRSEWRVQRRQMLNSLHENVKITGATPEILIRGHGFLKVDLKAPSAHLSMKRHSWIWSISHKFLHFTNKFLCILSLKNPSTNDTFSHQFSVSR